MNYLRDETLLKNFGTHIKRCRVKKNMTQKALSHIMDVEISQISRIEIGEVNPTLTTLIKLSEALELKIQDLFSFRK